jgi:ribosomal protein S18 acetylase RimI-like enzyme
MELAIRPMTEADLDAISIIYSAHAGEPPPPDWERRVRPLLEAPGLPGATALVAESRELQRGAGFTNGGEVVGYLVAEVRGWEFGSRPTGWIFGLGVRREQARQGVASRLLAAALERLRLAGVDTVRTMVRRDDLTVLTFFRSSGFSAGEYVELEHSLRQPGEPSPRGADDPTREATP